MHKTAERHTLGTMAQQVRMTELRKEIAKLEAGATVDDKRLAASNAMEELGRCQERAVDCLDSLYYLSIVLTEPKGHAKLHVAAGDARKKGMTSVREAIVRLSAIGLPGEEKVKGKLELLLPELEKTVLLTAEALERGTRFSKEDIDMRISSVYLLAVLKAYCSDSAGLRKILDGYLHESDGEMGTDYMRSLAGLKPKGGLGDWADNVISNSERACDAFDKFAAEEKGLAEKMSRAIGEERAAAEKARGLGVKVGDSYEIGGLKRDRELIEEKLGHKRLEARKLAIAIVEGAPELKVKEFDGLPRKRLEELAVFWEATPEHPRALRSLAQIYFELADWEKAKRAIDREFEVVRRLGTHDVITRCLELKVKILENAGDLEAAAEAKKHLSAHISVKIPFLLGRAKPQEETGSGDEDFD